MADCATAETERETEDDCTVISKESSLGIEAPTEKRKRARCFSPERKGSGDRRIWGASMYKTRDSILSLTKRNLIVTGL